MKGPQIKNPGFDLCPGMQLYQLGWETPWI